MGLSRRIEISEAGRAIASDERTGRQVEVNLSPDEIAQLEGYLRSADLWLPAKDIAVCADCFVYALRLETRAGTQAVELNDITLGDSGAQPLIQYLRGLMERALGKN